MINLRKTSLLAATALVTASLVGTAAAQSIRFWTTEDQPRWKNGQPAQKTTGVASRSWIQGWAAAGSQASKETPGIISPMASANSGAVRTALPQKRRLMAASSGSTSSAGGSVRGSKAMPHLGQGPGASRTTSGCIGQVYSTLLWGTAGSKAIPHRGQGTGSCSDTSGHMGQI